MINKVTYTRQAGIMGIWMLLQLFGTATAALVQPAPNPPNNVVLINIDDLGYSDLSCYGREYGMMLHESPNIDRFASQSLRFTQAYAASAICSASRVGLLTGKTPARQHFEFVTKYAADAYRWEDSLWVSQFNDKKLIPPPYTLNLPLEEYTLAEMLQDRGYATGMVGKWHVSSHGDFYNDWNLDFGPQKQGFEWAVETFGAWDKKNKKPEEEAANGAFPPDALTDSAVHFINQDHPKPFFLYVSHYYVHTPLRTELNWLLEKYKMKAERLHLKVSDQQIRYAAFVETIDHYVAQVLQALNEKGLMDHTTVIVTSDNGGMPRFAYNRPFRGSKWNLYEGGIRIPMMIHYPVNGQAHKGIIEAPVSQLDFLPTFYEMATGDSYNDPSVDGMSLVRLLTQGRDHRVDERELIWHFPYYHPEGDAFDPAPASIGVEDGAISQTRPHSAFLKAGMKLLYFYEDSRTELYELGKDPQESRDLSVRYPEVVKDMQADLLQYLEQVQARLPKKNTAFLE